MDSALFCPSGTMTNQIAIKSHTEAGDEVICDADSHIYLYEGGGVAFNSGCSMRLLPGDRGRLTASQVEEAVNNPDDVHKPLSRLVSLENTSNRGGGSCYDWKEVLAIREVCRAKGLALHLDGAGPERLRRDIRQHIHLPEQGAGRACRQPAPGRTRIHQEGQAHPKGLWGRDETGRLHGSRGQFRPGEPCQPT
jgi:hypothetical protein